MTISSAGYFGTVNDAQWAQLFEPLPHWFRSTAFVPTAVGGARTVSLTAGVAFGAGIRDTSDSATLVPLSPPSSGGQWYLVVLRRIWSIGVSGTTSVQALTGPATSGTIPTSPPATLPSTFQQTPSATEDAPVAWVHVRAADTTLTIFDGRAVLNGAGGISAASSALLALLPLVASIPVGLTLPNLADGIAYRWSGTTWLAWQSGWISVTPDTNAVNYGTGGTLTAEYKYTAGRVTFRGTITLGSGGTIGDGGISLPTPIRTGEIPEGQTIVADASDSFRIYPLLTIVTTIGAVQYLYPKYLTGSPVSSAVLSATAPIPWAAGDQLGWQVTYDPT